MKKYIMFSTFIILLSSCSKISQSVSKTKMTETSKPPIASKDIVHHEDKENERI